MATKKDLGGELGEYPNDKWKKFIETFAEINTLESAKWKSVHILGYFCDKYYKAYNVKYKFKFNSPSPSKSFEVFHVKRLALLLSSNPTVLRDYIDWVYKEKVEKGNRRFTSISFMTHEDLINNYKFNFLLSDKKQLHVDRSTNLPNDYMKVILDKTGHKIDSYGDLAFLNGAVVNGSFDKSFSDNWKLALAELEKLGFDVSLLDRLI